VGSLDATPALGCRFGSPDPAPRAGVLGGLSNGAKLFFGKLAELLRGIGMSSSDIPTKAEPEASEKAKARCGIIMPISATSGHSEKHWADIQKLLHRCVTDAGFQPVNVWINEASERISERMIGNIFSVDIAIADISDLNPNVMLELGLRLASKKPTIIVVNTGGFIPFDIRDFNAIYYPVDMNILGMEAFFEELAHNLTVKHASSISGSYKPFLSSIIVDVLSPETRTLPVDDLILQQLEIIESKVSSLESRIPRTSSRSRLLSSESRIGLSSEPRVALYIFAKRNSVTSLNALENLVDFEPNMIAYHTERSKRKCLSVSLYDEMEPSVAANVIVDKAREAGLETIDKIEMVDTF
jgi:hypothetical protein